MHQSKTKRAIALFVAIMMASLFSAVMVSAAQATFSLGDFNAPHNWAPGWNTDGRDYGTYPLQMETLQAATHLVLELSGNPDSELEVIMHSNGNNWGWQQRPVWDPADSEGYYTAVIDLSTIPEWANFVSEGPALLGIGGMGGMEHLLDNAYLILEGGAPAEEPAVTEVPATPDPIETPDPIVPVPITTPLPAAGESVLQLTLGSTAYTLNGASGALEVAPASVGGRTMVPFRFIGETLGAQIGWDAPTQTASFTLDGNTTNVRIGQRLYDGGVYMGTPVIEGGRTLVPVRFVSASMGAEVDWVPPGTVIVTFGGEAANVTPPVAPPVDDVVEEDCCDECELEDETADENGADEATDENGADDADELIALPFTFDISAAFLASIADEEAAGLQFGFGGHQASARYEGGAIIVYDRGNDAHPGWQGLDIMLEAFDISAGGQYRLTVEGTGDGAQLGLEWPLDGAPWDAGRVNGSGGSVSMTFSGNPADTPGMTVAPGQNNGGWRIRVNARSEEGVNVGDLNITAIRLERAS